MIKKNLNWIFYFGLLTFFAACQQEKSAPPPAGQLSEEATPVRLISLSGFLTEVLHELGHLDKVVGRDITSTYPMEKVADIPSLGHVSQLNAEAILALKPQMILVEEKQVAQSQVFQQLKDAGIEIVAVPTSTTLDNSIKASRFIEQQLSTDQQKIAALKKQIETDSLQLAETLGKHTDRPKVLFIYARGAGRLMVGGRQTAAASIIEKAGGQNAIQSFEDYRALTPESLVEAAPDVILMFTSGLASLDGKEGLAQISGIAQTPAYQNDRIVAMDGHYLTAFGTRAGRAALELAQHIHVNN